MLMYFKTFRILLFCALTVVSAVVKAQNCIDTLTAQQPTPCNAWWPKGVTERQWLWGAGRANVLDTYLSPLTYEGSDFAAQHRTERRAHWGQGRVTTVSRYGLHLAYGHSPTDDGKEWDAEFSAAGGWLYNWFPVPNLRLAAGGVFELSGGFTYNTRGSNNPAQGRMGISLNASGLAEYRFPLFRQMASVRLSADMQLTGAQFSPEYGQSYYEIFSLGHTDGIIHFTHPGNCPTYRLRTTVNLPLAGARLTLGYEADVRQSKLGGLKRHAWRNQFVVGYTRYLKLLR